MLEYEWRNVMFWVVQALGIVVCICTCLSFFFKEKWKMMITLTITNIVLMAEYILCGSLVGGLLCLGALLRTLVFFIYSKKNKKPDAIVLIFFEIYYIVISIVLWQNMTDLLILINLLVVTYTSWQDDMRILRMGYIASSMLLIPYDILLGAYTTIFSEVAMLVMVILSLIKYSKSNNNCHNIAQKYFVAQKDSWGTNVEKSDNVDLVTSSVDKSVYSNFGILKNYSEIPSTIMEIKNKCKENKIKEIAYLPFENAKINEFESAANVLNMFFPIEFHDTWMKLVDGFNLNNTDCKIKDITFEEIDETKLDDVVEVYLKGYCSKNDLSDSTEQEQIISDHIKSLKLNTLEENGYAIHAYVAYFHKMPVSLVVMLGNNVEAFVTKVCTLPHFRRKHIASALIQFGITKQRKNGVESIVLVTDKHSINEKFYAFNNFVEFAQAYALDVSDTTKYEEFMDDCKKENND